VRAAFALTRADLDLRTLLARSAALGLVLSAVELLLPPLIGARIGDPGVAAVVVGIASGGSYLATAGGSMGAAWFARRGAAHRALVATTALAAAAVLVLGAPALALVVAGSLVLYGLLGVAGPLASAWLHRRTTADRRATVLSVESLCVQAGGLVAALGLTRIAGAVGPTWAWVACAGALAGSALALGRRTRAAAPSGDGARATDSAR
jgi:hypothetical protein